MSDPMNIITIDRQQYRKVDGEWLALDLDSSRWNTIQFAIAHTLLDALTLANQRAEAAEAELAKFRAIGAMELREQRDKAEVERDALRKDAARLNAIESGEVDIECMGTTVRYFNLYSKRGKCVTASPSDSTPLTLRDAFDEVLGDTCTARQS